MSEQIVREMLSRYDISDPNIASRALREVLQELVLYSLYQARFFDSVVFYGGTALRIIHGLDRFSEDLDFSVRKEAGNFSFSSFGERIIKGLEEFGIESVFENQEYKSGGQGIARSNVRTGPISDILSVGTSGSLKEISRLFPANQNVRIRLEVDTGPPGSFQEESSFLLYPIAFPVLTMRLSSLFAGKMCALLCRLWRGRVKGRDWFDFIWFLKKNATLDLGYLEDKLRGSGNFESSDPLSLAEVKKMYLARVESLDVEGAIRDVSPFLRDVASIHAWSREFFMSLADRIEGEP